MRLESLVVVWAKKESGVKVGAFTAEFFGPSLNYGLKAEDSLVLRPPEQSEGRLAVRARCYS